MNKDGIHKCPLDTEIREEIKKAFWTGFSKEDVENKIIEFIAKREVAAVKEARKSFLENNWHDADVEKMIAAAREEGYHKGLRENMIKMDEWFAEEMKGTTEASRFVRETIEKDAESHMLEKCVAIVEKTEINISAENIDFRYGIETARKRIKDALEALTKLKGVEGKE
jgi:methionine salvage enolase-phosphatase E1